MDEGRAESSWAQVYTLLLMFESGGLEKRTGRGTAGGGAGRVGAGGLTPTVGLSEMVQEELQQEGRGEHEDVMEDLQCP